MATKAEPRSDELAWLLRALLVLQSPRAVFAAIRDDSDAAARARQESVLALVWLAGISAVLASPVASRLLNDPAFGGGLVVAVWAFLGGGAEGLLVYWLAGGLLQLAGRALGTRGSYRRARHVLAFASAPLALALFVYWPIRIAIYGGDLFRSGGSDRGHAFAWIFFLFVAWTLALLAIGVRTVHGWSWPRALAAVTLAGAGGALVVLPGALF